MYGPSLIGFEADLTIDVYWKRTIRKLRMLCETYCALHRSADLRRHPPCRGPWASCAAPGKRTWSK